MENITRSDLVKRADVIDAVESTDWYHQNRNGDMVSGANSDEHQAWYKADDIYRVLGEVPSATRKGEWITDGPHEVCKNCKEVRLFPHWKFCPNCGRKNK